MHCSNYVCVFNISDALRMCSCEVPHDKLSVSQLS